MADRTRGPRELLDARRHDGGKAQRLPLLWKETYNSLEVPGNTSIQPPVGFIHSEPGEGIQL